MNTRNKIIIKGGCCKILLYGYCGTNMELASLQKKNCTEKLLVKKYNSIAPFKPIT